MAVTSYPEAANYWTTPLFPGGTLLTATFRNQRFCRHWHETYVIPVIQTGAQRYWYRGAQHVAPARTIAAINPGEIHTGERATPEGWVYRAFYPTIDWMEGLATMITGGPAATPWFPMARSAMSTSRANSCLRMSSSKAESIRWKPKRLFSQHS